MINRSKPIEVNEEDMVRQIIDKSALYRFSGMEVTDVPMIKQPPEPVTG